MCHTVVSLQDAIVAVTVLESSMQVILKGIEYKMNIIALLLPV